MDHHAPFGSLARGVATFQPLISLNSGDTIAAGLSKFGPTGAHAESATQATNGAARATKSLSGRPFAASRAGLKRASQRALTASSSSAPALAAAAPALS